MSELIAIQHDVTATIKFKDLTWILEENKREPDVYTLAGLQVAEAANQLLTEELAVLNKPEELGGFTVTIEVSNPINVTAELGVPSATED